LNILFTKCVLNVSALIEPSSGRTLITSQNHLFTVRSLNWLNYTSCNIAYVFFPNYLHY
jgi:carbamoylphosphate synthase small subunit